MSRMTKTAVTSRASRWLALPLAALLLLAACSAGKDGTAGTDGPDASSVATEQGSEAGGDASKSGGEASVAAGAAATEDAPASEDAASESSGVAVSPEPLAALPERDIALYAEGESGVSEEGVVLEIGERRERFDWRYMTPRQIMPAMHAGDYDGDGLDELVVVLNIGSGTGVSVDELHVVEFNGVKDTQDEPFIDYKMGADDVQDRLGEALTFRLHDRGDGWFGEIAIGGQVDEIALDDMLASYGVGPDSVRDTLGYGSIVMFEADPSAITLRAAVGLVIDGMAEPQYIGSIAAEVVYRDGQFTLDRYRFEPEL